MYLSELLIAATRYACLVACGISALIMLISAIDTDRRGRNPKAEFNYMLAILLYYPVTAMYAGSDLKIADANIFLVRLVWFFMFLYSSNYAIQFIKYRNGAVNMEVIGEIVGYAVIKVKNHIKQSLDNVLKLTHIKN